MSKAYKQKDPQKILQIIGYDSPPFIKKLKKNVEMTSLPIGWKLKYRHWTFDNLNFEILNYCETRCLQVPKISVERWGWDFKLPIIKATLNTINIKSVS